MPRSSRRHAWHVGTYDSEADADRAIERLAANGWYVVKREVVERQVGWDDRTWNGGPRTIIVVHYRRGPMPVPPWTRSERPVFGDPKWIALVHPKRRSKLDVV